ncbi:hypothetical protein QAD02_012637 [Eretmocerus hayati]|uniref:Uncharacterized protein n=1 Tax=Eretmocerus hayati TaxID=131215 RepID=A0ACC2P094_9HYME|nr:hypothetical protein QAD02_012637 [Eretmocerus hayati]
MPQLLPFAPKHDKDFNRLEDYRAPWCFCPPSEGTLEAVKENADSVRAIKAPSKLIRSASEIDCSTVSSPGHSSSEDKHNVIEVKEENIKSLLEGQQPSLTKDSLSHCSNEQPTELQFVQVKIEKPDDTLMQSSHATDAIDDEDVRGGKCPLPRRNNPNLGESQWRGRGRGRGDGRGACNGSRRFQRVAGHESDSDVDNDDAFEASQRVLEIKKEKLDKRKNVSHQRAAHNLNQFEKNHSPRSLSRPAPSPREFRTSVNNKKRLAPKNLDSFSIASNDPNSSSSRKPAKIPKYVGYDTSDVELLSDEKENELEKLRAALMATQARNLQRRDRVPTRGDPDDRTSVAQQTRLRGVSVRRRRRAAEPLVAACSIQFRSSKLEPGIAAHATKLQLPDNDVPTSKSRRRRAVCLYNSYLQSAAGRVSYQPQIGATGIQ